MEQSRTPLPPGSLLILGGISYRLDAIEGCGSSAIVYQATYPDNLNPEALHRVLVKELFPVYANGKIHRAADGGIVCAAESSGVMEEARRRFRMGNQVNLELLQQNPAATAGNLNSYEAYGTYYSVLSLHGGETLLHRLNAQHQLPVREAAVIMRQMLRALECFHSRGLLHLDISPDNILLLPEQVLLIDFNSVWDTRDDDGDSFAFSHKPGYSPPEVLLENAQEICPATDLYACCAVFFHMLAGRRLREEELAGNLRKSLPAALPCFHDIPQTAAAKAATLLLRGLHPLPRRRYPSISALQADLEELIRRLDGWGVTESALWEVSAAAFRTQRLPPWNYLAQPVEGTSGVMNQSALAKALEQGGLFLLSGAGGMGKTRLMQELWAQNAKQYRPGAPVYWYLSLKDYQETGGASHFIRRALLQSLHFLPEAPHYADALHAVEKLLRQAPAKLVLLLDGLNEAGVKQEPLLREIEALGRLPGVGVLVTERSDAVLDYALLEFARLTLSPLTDAQIAAQFADRKMTLPSQTALRQLLTTPMLLFLYLEVFQLPVGAEQAPVPETQADLLSLYLVRFTRQTMREDSGDLASQLISRYTISHLLPQLAYEMQRRGRTALSREMVRSIAHKSYRVLRSRRFGAAFPDYLGKSRLMLAGLNGADEWYDLAVRERLMERFGLLSVTTQGQIALLHDSFLPILAQQHEGNRRILARRWRRRIIAVAAAVMLLAGIGTAALMRLHSQSSYTAEEQAEIYDALAGLNTALGAWSNQVSAQQEILERASRSDVLDNQDPTARAELADRIDLQRKVSAAYYTPAPDASRTAALEDIASDKSLFSPQALDALMLQCAAVQPVAEAAMTHLEDALCAADSVYDTRSKREQVIHAYATYLDAEIRYVSYLLADLMSAMTSEQQQEIWDAITYMPALDGFYDGAGSVAPERLADGIDRAWETVKTARLEMLAQGFSAAWIE